MYAPCRGRLPGVPWPFNPLLCMAEPRARRGGFLGPISTLVGKRSVGNPRPLAGDGLSMRSAQCRVWSTQGPAKPAVHTLVVWAAGLSTRARIAVASHAGCSVLVFFFFFQPPAGAAGGPPVGPCIHGSTHLLRSIEVPLRIVSMSRCTSVDLLRARFANINCLRDTLSIDCVQKGPHAFRCCNHRSQHACAAG